jgi:hypothetical protein
VAGACWSDAGAVRPSTCDAGVWGRSVCADKPGLLGASLGPELGRTYIYSTRAIMPAGRRRRLLQ